MEEKICYSFGNQEFYQKTQKILDEIESTFEKYGFQDMYVKYYNNEISDLELNNYIDNCILNISYEDQQTLNIMWTMLSSKNCWYVTYDVSQVIHNRLMKLWYNDSNYLIN